MRHLKYKELSPSARIGGRNHPAEKGQRVSHLEWMSVTILITLATFALVASIERIPFPSGRSGGKYLERVAAHADTFQGPGRLCLGASNAKYQLAMFGDYQCPPCRAAWRKLLPLRASGPALPWVLFARPSLPPSMALALLPTTHRQVVPCRAHR
jgi:hypothetical protein